MSDKGLWMDESGAKSARYDLAFVRLSDMGGTLMTYTPGVLHLEA